MLKFCYQTTYSIRYFSSDINLQRIYLYYRMGDFGGFVDSVEDLQKQLQREDLSNEEYKDLQAKFQVWEFMIKLLFEDIILCRWL